MAGQLPSSSSDPAPLAAINVTPFVDVTLVLLVIFMITAPALVQRSIQVKLPQSKTAQDATTSPLQVAINRAGQIYVNGNLMDTDQLESKARELIASKPDTQAIIGADRETRHEDLIKVIDAIRAAGISRFALQTETKSK